MRTYLDSVHEINRLIEEASGYGAAAREALAAAAQVARIEREFSHSASVRSAVERQLAELRSTQEAVDQRMSELTPMLQIAASYQSAPVFDDYDAQRRMLGRHIADIVAPAGSLAEGLREALRLSEMLEVTQRDAATFQELLGLARGPLIDASHLKGLLGIDPTMIEVWANLNRALAASAPVASPPARPPREKPEHPQAGSADNTSPEGDEQEGSLIQPAPTEALELLRPVDFVQLRLLDRMLRDPRAMLQLTPRQFEEFVAELVESLGFQDVQLTPFSRDGGRDIMAVLRSAGIPVIFAFECKRYRSKKVGVGVVRALHSTITTVGSLAHKGVIVTTSTFTKGASDLLITHEHSLEGRDFMGVVEWLEDSRSIGNRMT